MNNKITLYELLGLVKDGQAPKRIKVSEDIFIFVDGRYYEEHHINDDNGRLSDYYALDGMLNDEVEILDDEDEEKKIPEKIKVHYDKENRFQVKVDGKTTTEVMCLKINEIIDYLKSKGDE